MRCNADVMASVADVAQDLTEADVRGKKTLTVSSLLTALLLAQPALAQQENSLSFKDSIERAIMSNPELGARFQDFQSALEGQNVGRGALMPEINAQGWVGKEWRGSTSGAPSTDWSRRGYSLQLRQLIFDGFSSINQVRQLGYEKLATYYELLASVDSLALEAANAHIDVLRYREMEKLARENYGMHMNILGQIQERSASGVGRGVDLEQAYGRQSLAQSNMMTEAGNLNDVLQRYRRIVGVAAPEVMQAAPSLSESIPANTTDFLPSLRASPVILAKQALYQAAESGKHVAQGRMSPTLEFRAATGKDKSDPPGSAYRDSQSSNIQLMLSYNLFRGGADAARIRQTTAQQYAARDVRDYTCRNVQQDLAVAWNNIERLRAQLPFLKQHELATSKVRVAYMQQFQIGQRSLLDLLDTENELFDARRALANATYDLQQAEYRWLTLSHRLVSAVGLSQPYSEQPEEAAKLDFPEEAFKACMTPVPDTSNLTPVSVDYRDGMAPPVLREKPAGL